MQLNLPICGGCQCGGIRYEIRAEPLTLYACHCTQCQRQSTGAFSLSMVVTREAVALVAGEPKTWLRRHESGRLIDCLFCPECGCRLFHNPRQNGKITIVKAGTLDNARWLEPVGHIWTSSAQGWLGLPDWSLRYAAQPPDFSALIEAWNARQASDATRPASGRDAGVRTGSATSAEHPAGTTPPES